MAESTTGPKFIFLLLGFVASLLVYGAIVPFQSPQNDSACFSAHTCNPRGKEPKNSLLVQEVQSIEPAKEMKNLPVSEPCMQRAISFKESQWSCQEDGMSYRDATFSEAMSCIQRAYEKDGQQSLPSQDDVDVVVLANVLFDPETLSLRLPKGAPSVTEWNALKVDRIRGDESYTAWNSADRHPWMLVLPPSLDTTESTLFSIGSILSFANTQLYPHLYSDMSSLLLPSLDQLPQSGLSGLIPAFASMRKEAGRSIPLYSNSDCRQRGKSGWLFFPSLTLLGPLHRGGLGGVVRHVFDASYYRAAVYKHFQINTKSWKQGAFIIWHVTRLNNQTKEMRINKNALQYASGKVNVGVQSLLNEQKIHNHVIQSRTTKELVEEVSKVDVLLAVSSPVLSLMLFMRPHSGVLEVLPKDQKTAMFGRLATSLELMYHTHYQLETSPFERLAPPPYEAFIDQYTLWQYLASLKTTVSHFKYFI